MKVFNCLHNPVISLIVCPSCLRELFFCISAFFIKPWCQRLSPFVWVSGKGPLKFFDYSSCDCFLNYKLLYSLCPFIVCSFIILYYFLQLRYKCCFLCMSCPYFCRLVIIGYLCAIYPLICDFLLVWLALYGTAAI